MTPSQLLTRIKDLGKVDAKYVERIQKQIDDPDKEVKLKAMVSYLVKKNQISKAEAATLLKPPTEDEMEVDQPAENSYDTGALIGNPREDETPERVVDPVVEASPREVEAAEVIADPGPADAMAYDPHPAPAIPDGGFDEGFSSGSYAATSGTHRTTPTFAGKRDQKDQFKTSWLYIAFGTLGVILIGVVLLYIINVGRNPDEMFKAAMDSYNRGAYGDAAAKLENFIESYPGHEQEATARTRRVHALLRETYSAQKYKELISQADTLLTPLAEEEDTKIGIIRDDLGVILPSALLKITDRAVQTMLVETENVDIGQMESQLEEINQYKAVVDNPVFVPPSSRKQQSNAERLSKIDNNIRTIVGQIEKEKQYGAALEQIASLRDESKTDEAFDTYRRLTRNYGDLAAREPLQKLMLTISEKESQLVQPIDLPLQPSTSERDSAIDATVVLSVKTGETVTALKGEVLPFLVDGSVYGIDAGTGTIVWRRFVGLATLIPPVSIDAERTLISDMGHHDLICVRTQTGELLWRVEIGEPFETPAVLDTQVVVSTDSGKVIQLESGTGTFDNAAKLPQSTGPTAMIGQRDPYIYQVGEYSNLYAISTQSFECEEVYSLGHYENAVAIPPYQWSGYLLVAVNGGSYCDLHVLKPDERGLGLKRVQLLPRITDGLVTRPFVKAGRSVLMMSDNGQIRMLDIDPTNELAPVQPIAQVTFSDETTQRPFLAADGSHIWQAGSGLLHARIKRNQGTIDRDMATEARDQFISQVRAIDDYVLHIRRRADSGMISASLADGLELNPVWRTDFAGPLAGSPVRQGDDLLAVSNQGDLFPIGTSQWETGFAEDAKRTSTVVENLQFSQLLSLGNGRLVATSSEGRADLMYYDGSQPQLLTLSPPANQPTTEPLSIGDDLIIPSATGHVARIDPKSGARVGTPFQPPISPNSKINWLPPVQISDSTIAIASAESPTDPSSLFLLSVEDRQRVSQLAEIQSSEPFRNRLATDGQQLWVVLSSGGGDKLAVYNAAAPLAQQSAIDLPGASVAGPWLTEAGVLIKLDNDKLHCFAPDLTERWSLEVGNQTLACPPEVAAGQLMLCYQSGRVMLLDPDSGTATGEFDLQQPIVHRPLREDQKMYFGGMDGTVHVVDLEKISQ